ncbi:MAG: sterol desaturase family protein [Hyphomonas sp.]
MTETVLKSNVRPLVVGEGRISAYLCCFFGVLSLLGVLAFMFPSYLTTPELRAAYNPAHLRIVMAVGLVIAAGCGGFALYQKAERKLAMLGLGAGLLAMLLGGPDVAQGVVEPGALYIGVDWFIIGLLTTGIGFVVLEKLAPLRRDQSVLRGDWALDLKHFLLHHLLIGFFLFAGNYVVHNWFGWAVVPAVGAFIGGLPFVVQFLLLMLFVDLGQYWAHRAYHNNDFLWRVHSVHHSTEHMDWLAGSRLHILEPLVTRTIGLVTMAVLGFEQGPMNAYILFIGFHATFIHANCAYDLKRLDGIFVTPRHHHWHHAQAKEAMNKNYAIHFSFLDRMFGSFYLPKEWPEAYGVVHGAPPKGLLKQQLHPFNK